MVVKEYCYKIPSADMPLIQKVLKGKDCRFGTTYEEPPGKKWFHCMFDAGSDDEFLAYMFLNGYEEVSA